jgi:hypothetical protein
LRKLFCIKEVHSVALDEICEGTVGFLSFFNEFFSHNQSRDVQTRELDSQRRFQYPVCASIEIIRTASLENNAHPQNEKELNIKFIYVLELSGLKKDIEKMEYGIFSKPTYEIREYYGTEHEWLSNEENNLCVKKSHSAVDVHRQMLEFSVLQLFNSKATKENVISHYHQLCLNTPGTLRFYQHFQIISQNITEAGMCWSPSINLQNLKGQKEAATMPLKCVVKS